MKTKKVIEIHRGLLEIREELNGSLKRMQKHLIDKGYDEEAQLKLEGTILEYGFMLTNILDDITDIIQGESDE